MSAHDRAREAVTALVRAAWEVRSAAVGLGSADPGLEFDLDALAADVEDALIEFQRSTGWDEARL